MKVALALGGGGVRGSAHVGVLRVLERRGHQVGAIASSSIGGLIGALYLAGLSPEDIQTRFAGADYRYLFRRGPDVDNALLGQTGLIELLHDTLGERTFADLPVPFAVTAVDLVTGQELVLRHGRLLDAVLATSAVPGVFPPRPWRHYELVDGGLSNPVPVALARELAPRLPVIAVVLTKPPDPHRELPHQPVVPSMPVLDRLTQFRIGQAFQVFTRSITISGRLLTELRLDIEKPDLIIRPDVDEFSILEDVDAAEIVRRGEQAAETALPMLEQRPNWLSRAAQRLRDAFTRR